MLLELAKHDLNLNTTFFFHFFELLLVLTAF